MFRFWTLLVVILVSLFSLSVCSAGEPLKLGEKDAGQAVVLQAGDLLEVVLEGNPTTGYMWEVASVDATVLKAVGEPQFKPSSGATGAGGEVTLTFKAVGAGQTTLKLVYHRPWEKDVPPDKTFDVTVTVLSKKEAGGSVRLTAKNGDQAVVLQAGDLLEVVLEGNPTTGYMWEVASVDATVLKAVGEPQFKPSSGAAGAGGELTFIFKAVAAGQTPLRLIYHRPWEKDAPPIKKFEVPVTVLKKPGTGAVVKLSEKDAGQAVELKAGDTLEVVLEGNPTTGYMWEVASVDAAVLKVVGEPQFKPSTQAIGSGGEVALTFTTVGAGQTTLKLAYHRPWEKDVPPDKTFEVPVTVKMQGTGVAMKLGEKDAGQAVELKVGDVLEVVLEGNPTTGYSWEVASVDATILKATGEPQFEPSSEAIGAGGEETWTFKAMAAGQTVLKLVYHQPWEKDVPPDKTFEVPVTVK